MALIKPARSVARRTRTCAARPGSALPSPCAVTQNAAAMRRAMERCGDCRPGVQCANHQACATHHDAALAAEIGAAWAVFVRRQLDVRKPWPAYEGRAAAIALRLVEKLAPEPRRSELARICHWRAGLRWEALELTRIRDRPYEPGEGGGEIVTLPGIALSIQFRTKRQRVDARVTATTHSGRRGRREH